MSLILDALRKADSEREIGSVPGLNARPVSQLSERDGEVPRGRRVPWLIGGGAGLVLLAVGAWFLVPRQTASVPALPSAPASVAPTVSASAPVAAESPAPAAPTAGEAKPRTAPPDAAVTPPQAPTPAAAPSESAASPPPSGRAPVPTAAPAAPAPIPPAAEAAPIPPPAPPVTRNKTPGVAEIKTKGSRSAIEPPAGGTAAAPAARKPEPAAAPDSPIYSRDQLPEQVGAGLPQLTIGGSIYAMRASDRSLLINGRLFREGDALTPELSLERIEPRSAVFRTRGYRFEVRF